MKAQLLIASLAAVISAGAHNNYFLPGDAFFSTSFSEDRVAKIKEENPTQIELNYERLENHFMSCGNIGYSALKLTEVDEAFRKNLLIAYEWVRRKEMVHFVKTTGEGKEALVEWNPVVALVYSKGQVSFPLGLKFNEHWKEQGVGLYGGFLDDGWSVVQDWKRGEQVASLKLTEPLAPMAHLSEKAEIHHTVDTVLTMKAAEAELVFVGILKKNSWVNNECLNLKNLAAHENWTKRGEENAFYLRVTSEGVRLVTLSPGEEKKESVRDDKGNWIAVEKG